MVSVLLVLALHSGCVLSQSSARPYDCQGSAPISVLLEGPHHTIELESRSYPAFPLEGATGDSRCQWKVAALHGAQVEVTVLEVELATDCVSTSALRLEDKSSDSSHPLHYPGLEARCNQESSIPPTCLTSEGQLTITATPGLRFRLQLKAVLPLECPAKEPENHCPQGPCCGEADCTCKYLLGSQPLELQPSKPGTCSYSLVSSPGSQVSVNFLEMRLPSQASSPSCESWVSLGETGGHQGSVIGSQKYCGLTVPNYPGPSVLTSGSNSLTVNYFLPEAGRAQGHGFKVAAAAVNPLCAPLTYQHKSGPSSCSASCGTASQPQYPERDQCPFPDPVICMGPDCPETGTTTSPCQTRPEKVLIVTVMENGTDISIGGAEVNITSGLAFFQHRSSLMGEVRTQGVEEATALTVSVVAEGYLAREQVFNLDCYNDGCFNCEMMVFLDMDKVPMDGECLKTMKLDLKVEDEDNSPVAGVKVSVSYVVGETAEQQNVVDGVITDQTGAATVPISVNGDYKITLVKEDMVDQELDVTVENCTGKEEKIIMEKSETCKGTLSFHIKNDLGEGIEGAEVSVFRPRQTSALDLSPRTTDSFGGLEHLLEPGLLRVEVSAPGYLTKSIEVNCTCQIENVVLELASELTTTPGPTCYGSEATPVLLTVRVFDLLTKKPVVGAKADMQVEAAADDTKSALIEDALMGAVWNTTIKMDGKYSLSVTAEGYQVARKSVDVVCDSSNCAACSTSMELPLTQKTCTDSETCCDEDNMLRVEVRDSSTLAVVPGAHVAVALKTAEEGRRAVSPYGQCSQDPGADSCGFSGISATECRASSCCWNRLPALVRDDPHVTGDGTGTGTGTGKESESTTASLSSGTEGTTHSPARTTAAAPSFGTLYATCDNIMDVFFDGVRQPNHTSMANWQSASKFDIPFGTSLLAIRCRNTDPASPKGILASIDGNSQVYNVRTDDTWRCSSQPVQGWTAKVLEVKDRPLFRFAEILGGNGMQPWGLRPRIRQGARWIWASTDTDKPNWDVAYCRKRLLRKDQPVEEQTNEDDDTSLSGPGICSARVGDKPMTTDNSGLVSTELPGQAEYLITVTRPGFKTLKYSWTSSRTVETTNQTAHCEVTKLVLTVNQVELCSPKGLPLSLTVVDAVTQTPLPGTSVHLLLTSSALGASQVEVGGSLSTDLEGVVSPSLYTNGTYRVTASLPGFFDLSKEISLPAEVCTSGLNLTMALTPTPPHHQCDQSMGTKLTLTVRDIHTEVAVEGALVDITYQENTTTIVAEGVRTDQLGEAQVPVSKLGMYKATLRPAYATPHSAYLGATTSVNLTCCSCPANLMLSLDQVQCPNPLMNVTVMDNSTGLTIPGARISLLLTGSQAGLSMTMQGSVLTTNLEGIAVLHPTINGNYSVKVEAENYQPREVPVQLACDPLDCTRCSLEVMVELEETFCSHRTLKLIVRDSTNNTALEGTLVTIVKETHHGPNALGSFTVDEVGEVHLPLVGNGHYSTSLSRPGYINLTTTLRVVVTPDQCELLAPMELVAMSPVMPLGCARLSLTWGQQPQDLDLYSYRVSQNQTEDQCLTYFCDGKDPCQGVDFNTDNKAGGEAGSETITYCEVDDFSHMVWVDDRSGLGASLLGSEARLVITAGNGESQEVVLRPSEGQEPTSRYWLAGCLTTTPTSFSFLTLNQFTSGSPDLEQPLHCHSRTQLQSGPATPMAEVHVSVGTIKGEPLPGVLISLKSPHQTYSRTTGGEGKLVLPVSEDGDFSLLAQLDGHVPERLNFSLSCSGLEGEQCATSAQITMMKLQEDGALRIKLNWPGDAGRDLDIHLVEVQENEPQMVCHTYWNNRAGCMSTELDQNVGTGAVLGRALAAPSFGTLHATCNSRMDVYFDGVRQPNNTSMANWRSATKFDIPDGTSLVAIRCLNKDPESPKGLLASTEGNSQIYAMKTDDTWRCSSQPVKGWTANELELKDRPLFRFAEVLGGNGMQRWGPRNRISKGARWIWAPTDNDKPNWDAAYCRKRLLRKEQPVEEGTNDGNDSSLLSGEIINTPEHPVEKTNADDNTSLSLGETITVHNMAARASLRYMLYVDDNTATGADLSKMQPQLTLSQGSTFVTDQMPKLPSTQGGARFWLAGAIEVVGSKFRYVPAKSWSKETPNSNPGLVINNLLSRPVDRPTPRFCEGARLGVSVTNALTREGVTEATVTVLRLQDGQEQVIVQAAAPDVQGKLSLPISAGGQYEVKVEGAGLVSTRKSTSVSCSPSDCSLCTPEVVMQVSPSLAADQLRLTLGGEASQGNLDLKAVFRDSSAACVTSPSSGSTQCPGVEAVTGTGEQGMETITFARPSEDAPHVYTLYVTWTPPTSGPEPSFATTNTWISISDGSVTEEVHMEAAAYGGERHWLAACLLINGSAEASFQLKPLNVFFTKTPDEEVPNLCLKTFGLAEKAPKWSGQCVQDRRSRLLPVDFGKSSDNSPEYCRKKCRSQEYAFSGVEYGSQCFCGNTPPPQSEVLAASYCNSKCPADSTSKCGGSWRLNVYETGYTSGLTMVSGHSCDCSYSPGGCSVSSAPPAGFACVCKYQGYMACGATLKQCGAEENCPGDCKSKACCKNGGGDCGGYWG